MTGFRTRNVQGQPSTNDTLSQGTMIHAAGENEFTLRALPVISPDRQLNEAFVESCHFLFAEMPTQRTQIVVELLDCVAA